MSHGTLIEYLLDSIEAGFNDEHMNTDITPQIGFGNDDATADDGGSRQQTEASTLTDAKDAIVR